MGKEPTADSTELSVLSPVADKYGEGAYSLAPRLATLENKTLGLVWNGKPNGDVALKRAGEVLQQMTPGLKVIFYSGTLPCTPELLEQVARESDAAFAATADCGSCSSWIAHDCGVLERAGLPTVVIATAGFEHDIVASAQAFSMPTQQFVIVPKGYNNISVEQSLAQTDPIVEEAARLLTSNSILDGGQSGGGASIGQESFFTEGDELPHETFNRSFLERGWTDAYPVWPPTEKRVARLIEAVDGSPDDVVCMLPPGNGAATVAKIAVNAAMAGCEPAEMPVIMAALRAMAHKGNASIIRAAMMSTGAQAPLVLVNGPIAKELNINGGRCCIGPGKQNLVNIRIGRAIHFCLKNLARWVPGIMDLDSVGTSRKNIVVLAENEEESPWEPYHVSKGYEPTDNIVTVWFTGGEVDISIQGHIDGHQLAKSIASFGFNNTGYPIGMFGPEPKDIPLGRLIIVPPPHAIPVSEAGYSKRAFESLLFQSDTVPAARLIEPLRKLHESGKTRQEYEWLFDLPEDQLWKRWLPVVESQDMYTVVVAGSVRAKDLLMPTRTLPEMERITTTPRAK